MSFDFSTLKLRLDEVNAKPAGNPRGKALEQLTGELFESLPGVAIEARNVLAGSREAEFDIQLSNDQLEEGLPGFGRDLFVECKSSGEALGAAGVQHFAGEMHKRRILWSVIVSLEGITGDAEAATAAQRQIADYALLQCWVMVFNERELRALRSVEHFSAVVESKRRKQLGRRNAVELNDVEVGALNPDLVLFSSGHAAIARALRAARDSVLDEVLRAADALPELADAAALNRVEAAAQTLQNDITARKEEPEDDPLWLATRQVLIDFGAALVPTLDATLDVEIDVPKTVRFEVNNTAPQRLGAHVGSELWRLLVEHHLKAVREPGAWRPRRSIYALVAMIVEEVMAIDEIDPADVFDLHGYTDLDDY